VDLRERVAAGGFREDLYFRLNVIPIPVPALRERPEEIVLLADHFLVVYGEGRRLTLDEAARDALLGYPWPGNVRELKNLCRRLALLVQGTKIHLDSLPDTLRAVPAAGGDTTLAQVERDTVVHALESHGWNQSAAARALGVPRHVLLYRMKKHQIHRPE